MKTTLTRASQDVLSRIIRESCIILPSQKPAPTERMSLVEVASETLNERVVNREIAEEKILEEGMIVICLLWVGLLFAIIAPSTSLWFLLVTALSWGSVALGEEHTYNWGYSLTVYRYLFQNPGITQTEEEDARTLFREWAEKHKTECVEHLTKKKSLLDNKLVQLEEKEALMEAHSEHGDEMAEIATQSLAEIRAKIQSVEAAIKELKESRRMISASFRYVLTSILPDADRKLRFVADLEDTRKLIHESTIEVERARQLCKDVTYHMSRVLGAVTSAMDMVDAYVAANSEMGLDLTDSELPELIPAHVLEEELELERKLEEEARQAELVESGYALSESA